MSADNGIYILETNAAPDGTLNSNKEYRVRHLQAIENLSYDNTVTLPECPKGYTGNEFMPENTALVKYQEAYRNKFNSHNPDVMINNAREMFVGCTVFSDKTSALCEASKIEEKINDEGWWVEYGISIIRIDRVF